MRHHLTAACSALLLAAAVVVPWGLPATASTPDDRGEVEERQGQVQEGLQSSREDLEHVSADLVAASDRLSQLQAQLPAARAAVDQAQAEAAAARQRDAELADELALAEAAVTAAGLELQERTGEADETEKVVASVAREVYQGSGFTPLTILVEAESAGDYADMVAFAAVARRSQNQALSRLRVQQADIRNAEAQAGGRARPRRGAQARLPPSRSSPPRPPSRRPGRRKAALDGLVAERGPGCRRRSPRPRPPRSSRSPSWRPRSSASPTSWPPSPRRSGRQSSSGSGRSRPSGSAQPSCERQAPAVEIQRQTRGGRHATNRPVATAPAAHPRPPVGARGAGQRRLPVQPGQRPDVLVVRLPDPPDPRLPQAAHRTGLRRGPAAPRSRRPRPRAVVSAGWGGGYGNLVVITARQRRRQLPGHRLRAPEQHGRERRAERRPGARSSATSAPPAARPGATCTSRRASPGPRSTRCAISEGRAVPPAVTGSGGAGQPAGARGPGRAHWSDAR